MPGNITNFDKLDVVRCFLLLNENRSRNYLKSHLDIGEGSIRGILGMLKEKKLIDSSRQGHVHSSKGVELFKHINQVISFPIYFDKKNTLDVIESFFPIYKGLYVGVGLLFKYDNIKNVFIYRDYAIKAGCEGAMMLIYKDKKLSLPSVDYNENLSLIKNNLKLDKNCLVIIVVGKNKRDMDKGILNIIDNMTDIFKEL